MTITNEQDKQKNIFRSQLFRVKEKLTVNATQSELVMKKYLDDLGISYVFQKAFTTQKNVKFRVVDFYIKRCALIIEIDGGYHFNEKQRIADCLREEEIFVKKKRWRIWRFTNEEVLNFGKELQDKLHYIKISQTRREGGERPKNVFPEIAVLAFRPKLKTNRKDVLWGSLKN